MSELTDTIQAILRRENYCVISTVTPDGLPEAAYVSFSANDKFEIMIGTSTKSRKFQNISNNPSVAIVFSFDGKETIQYGGQAHVLKGQELNDRLEAHFVKHPGARKYLDLANQSYISITPQWVRLSKAGPSVLGLLTFGDNGKIEETV
jgi:hypothetical protein